MNILLYFGTIYFYVFGYLVDNHKIERIILFEVISFRSGNKMIRDIGMIVDMQILSVNCR